MNSLQDVVTQQEQEALGLLRDWISYLQARLVILDQREAHSDAAFDRQSVTADLAAAEAQLAGLEPVRRSLFEQALLERREQQRVAMEEELRNIGSQRLIDPDQLDRTTLNSLRSEAQEPDETGHVLFPAGDSAQIEWMELRASALSERPDARVYRMAGRLSAERDRLLRIGAAVVALILTAVAFWMLFAPDDPGSNGAALAPTADGQILRPWQLTSVTLVGDQTTTLALTSLATGQPADGQAGVWSAGTLPLVLCAPADALVGIREIRVRGDGSVPERLYVVKDTPAPDLEIGPCATDAAAERVSAMLQQLVPAPAAAAGSSQPVGPHTIRLAGVVVSGAAETPEVPQGAARVAVTLSVGGATVDWPALAPTLRLGDGAQQTAPEVRSVAGGITELRFLVSAPVEALPAELRLTDPATGQVVRWWVTIPPPLDRSRFLAQALRVDELVPARAGELGLIVTNASSLPITLARTDLTIEANGLRTAPAAVSGAETALAPGETRTLTCSLPPDLPPIVTLTIGTAVYRITS
jgi:hypothetical protein